MHAGVRVSFYGVRGSTPCHCSSMNRFGGNTSCVVIEREGEAPIVCDAGTGLRFFGLDHGRDHFLGTILVSHLHWDHVQGLPFFPQLLNEGSTTTIYGPPEDDESFGEALCRFVQPPYFPVQLDNLPGEVRLVDIDRSSVQVESATVTAGRVPHTGNTNGYRIEWPEFSLAYLPDHQEPADPTTVGDDVLELASGVDLLIHDAQFSAELLAKRPTWGHCTPEYAVRVAEMAGASRLALFHHDPLHDDDAVDSLVQHARSLTADVEIFGAAEGLKLSY